MTRKNVTRKLLDDISYEVIGSAIYVHKELGRGLSENIYHECMKEELEFRKIKFQTELIIPVIFRSKILEANFRCDLFVEECLVIELKTVHELTVAFEAQLLTYMKLLKAPKGMLINFQSDNIFRNGQKTFLNEFYKNLNP